MRLARLTRTLLRGLEGILLRHVGAWQAGMRGEPARSDDWHQGSNHRAVATFSNLLAVGRSHHTEDNRVAGADGQRWAPDAGLTLDPQWGGPYRHGALETFGLPSCFLHISATCPVILACHASFLEAQAYTLQSFKHTNHCLGLSSLERDFFCNKKPVARDMEQLQSTNGAHLLKLKHPTISPTLALDVVHHPACEPRELY